MKASYNAFTLAEMLIALVLVGVLAAITLPKVLSGSQDKQVIATWKSNLSALQTTLVNGNSDGTIMQADSLTDYLSTQLRARKSCLGTTATNDFKTGGCYTLRNPVAGNEGGFVLSSGFTITDIATSNTLCKQNPELESCDDSWVIDVNGEDGPNITGQDLLTVQMRWGGRVENSTQPTTGMRPGDFVLDPSYDSCAATNTACANAKALWKKIGY